MQALRLAALTAIVLYASAGTSPIVKDAEGRTVQPVADGTAVLIFTRGDCPVSNRYAPELARLYRQTRDAGVQFWLVYVDASLSAEAVRAHARGYGYPFAALLDPHHELVRFAGARVTPEAAVFANGRLVYRGRIDDRHVRPGVTRREASVRDLEDTLSRLSAGETLRLRTTTAIGCFIGDVR